MVTLCAVVFANFRRYTFLLWYLQYSVERPLGDQSILLRVSAMENGSMRCKIVARWILVVPIYESMIFRIKAFSPILSVIPLSPPSTLNIMLVNVVTTTRSSHFAINYFFSFPVKRKRRNNKRTGKLLVSGNHLNLTYNLILFTSLFFLEFNLNGLVY